MKKSILFVAMLLTTCSLLAQHDHHSAASEKTYAAPTFGNASLGNAYTQYIELKNALVSSDAASARKAATLLQKSLKSVPGGQPASGQAAKISATADLSAQRESFTLLSDEMAALVKATKLTSGAVYVEYCPMANNNKGAVWLSNEKEIRNPYFGDKMLKCGSVKETVQ
jgi:hypothetical protein